MTKMKIGPKQAGNARFWFGTMTMLLGSAFMVRAAAPSTVSTSAHAVDQSKQAARLLRDIKADAVSVRTAAMGLDTLTASSAARWLDYDRQWNEIKPSVEDMQIKLARLEPMKSALSPAERTELDQSKPVIGEIQNRTHQLFTLLGTPGVQTKDAKFKAYASSLKNEADKLEKLVPAA